MLILAAIGFGGFFQFFNDKNPSGDGNSPQAMTSGKASESDSPKNPQEKNANDKLEMHTTTCLAQLRRSSSTTASRPCSKTGYAPQSKRASPVGIRRPVTAPLLLGNISKASKHLAPVGMFASSARISRIRQH